MSYMMIGYDIYNGAFSIASKNDLDDQNLLLARMYTALNDVEAYLFHFSASSLP
jgi:hypothetical protein